MIKIRGKKKFQVSIVIMGLGGIVLMSLNMDWIYQEKYPLKGSTS